MLNMKLSEGHAVAYHRFPRFTGDIDFFIELSSSNLSALAKKGPEGFRLWRFGG
jgi:hypothetical protein